MQKKGSITIFLCIVLVSVLLVVSIASESARVGVVQAECNTFTGMAGESVLAGYAKQVYEDYGILLVWENYPMEDQIKENIQANINLADLKGSGTNFLGTELTEVIADNKRYVTDKGGEAFVHQIVQYMKYGGFLEAAQKLIQESNKEERNTLEYDTSASIDVVEEKSKELMDLADEIEGELKDLRDVSKIKTEYEKAEKSFGRIREAVDSEKGVNKVTQDYFLENFHAVEEEINKKKERISDLLFSMKKYVKKREDFLKETNAVSTGEDFVDRNLNIVKNVKGKVDELEGLSVSNISEVNQQTVQPLAKAVGCMGDIVRGRDSITTRTGKEDENTSLFQKAKSLMQNGVLSLVVDDVSKVSKNTVSDSGLPSNNQDKAKTGLLKKLENKALLAVYAGIHFGNYIEEKQDTCLKYEIEYLIQGDCSDKKNLLGTIERLLAFRNIANGAYLLTDKEKMSEIHSVAAAAAAALEMPFLEPLITAVLTEAWALVEAASDVRALLKGDQVPLAKSEETWYTDLWSLGGDRGDGEKGLTYLEYCQLLIMASKSQDVVYRTMDLIQLNIQTRYQPSFRMNQCLGAVDFKAVYRIKPVFLAPSSALALMDEEHQGYRYECSYKNSY
ncbi:MAG: DUF5702 domain-containing protein [Eubacterium sp.]|nr:DUF5702 domain-containing protein [Eubacterium sp.]